MTLQMTFDIVVVAFIIIIVAVIDAAKQQWQISLQIIFLHINTAQKEERKWAGLPVCINFRRLFLIKRFHLPCNIFQSANPGSKRQIPPRKKKIDQGCQFVTFNEDLIYINACIWHIILVQSGSPESKRHFRMAERCDLCYRSVEMEEENAQTHASLSGSPFFADGV